MGSWNSGFKKIAEMMPTAFRRDVAGFARVFTSPLQRAMQTCELAGFAARAEIDRDLLEWNSQTEGDPPECDIGFLDRLIGSQSMRTWNFGISGSLRTGQQAVTRSRRSTA
jgi:broad specificity phosphatase PhoE